MNEQQQTQQHSSYPDQQYHPDQKDHPDQHDQQYSVSQQDQQDNELEIDLVQMGLYLLRKWNTILIIMIVGALLGAAFALIPPKEPSMDDVNVKNVNTQRLAQYVRYQQQYKEQVKFERESLVMQMDPSGVFNGELAYFLSSNASSVELICLRFNDILNQDEVRDELLLASGLDTDKQHLRELVSVAYWLTDSNDFNIATQGNTVGTEKTANVRFSVFLEDSDRCRAMLDLLEKHCSSLLAQLEQEYPSSAFNCVTNTVKKADVATIQQMQENYNTQRSNAFNQIALLDKEINNDEKTAYEVLYPEENTIEWKPALVKNTILGAMICFFVVITYLCIRFVMRGGIWSAQALRSYNLFLLANLRETPSEKNKIDKRLERIGSKALSPINDRAYLKSILTTPVPSGAMLCGDLHMPETKALMDWCKSEIPSLSTAGLLQDDPAAKGIALKAEGVIFVLRLGKMTVGELRRELEIAHEAKIKVIGAVTIW